ncbi:MAG: SRPBCC family protein, partial [Candidatus Methylomirabilales bacterium]
MTRRGLAAWLLLGMLAAAASGAPARAFSDPEDAARPLTPLELARLRGGGLVVRTADVPDFPWPEVRVYRAVAATPAQVMAVYTDLETQATYMPGLVSSRVVKRAGASAFHVSYEAEVTGPNERYTVVVAVVRTAAGFQATWQLLTARYARRLSGGLHVEPLDEGALVTYSSRVDPGRLGSAFGTPELVSRRVQATVEALA